MTTKNKVATKRTATAIPEKTLTDLKKHEWRIFTDHKNTQDVLAQYLADKSELESSKAEIFYNGKVIPVFIVSFLEVEWLRKNRGACGYKFTAYHKDPKRLSKSWMIWNKGKKGPNDMARKIFCSKL